MHAPSDFALAGRCNLRVAVPSTRFNRRPFVKFATTQGTCGIKMSDLPNGDLSCYCLSPNNDAVNSSTAERDNSLTADMISYQQRATMKRTTSSRSQVISLLPFACLRRLVFFRSSRLCVGHSGLLLVSKGMQRYRIISLPYRTNSAASALFSTSKEAVSEAPSEQVSRNHAPMDSAVSRQKPARRKDCFITLGHRSFPRLCCLRFVANCSS